MTSRGATGSPLGRRNQGARLDEATAIMIQRNDALSCDCGGLIEAALPARINIIARRSNSGCASSAKSKQAIRENP